VFCAIIEAMKKQSLLQTNPYLKNPIIAQKLIERSVTSSCGVEGIKVDLKMVADIRIPEHLQKGSSQN